MMLLVYVVDCCLLVVVVEFNLSRLGLGADGSWVSLRALC